MTHVFVVNETTFKYHLEYLFAGTGAKDLYPDFINSTNTVATPSEEKLLTQMLADISRISIGDKIIFYLEGEYKFYGVFKVVSNPFLDSKVPHSCLQNLLGRPLPFRILLDVEEVYPIGVSEHQALDSLLNINHAYEMNWSLILRKLKGKRGCTMITDPESRKLINLIKSTNSNTYLNINTLTQSLTYNSNTKEIEINNSNPSQAYLGIRNRADILPRFITKIQSNTACEAHLQAYIIQSLLSNSTNKLKQLLLNNSINIWVGNEVSCSVGMQRIDILTIEELENKYIFNVLELKHVLAENYIIYDQLPWYIEWLTYYIFPHYINKPIEINPVVITKKPSTRTRRVP